MSIRILLADDHQIMRDGLRAILASDESIAIVGEAENGREAVALAGELVPDLVIMDIGMPDLNGVEATRQIKADNPRVKVIALSMYADRGYVLGILEAGASGYVLKRSAYDELHRAVRAVMRGKNYLSPDVTGMVVDARALRPDGSEQEATQRDVQLGEPTAFDE